MKKIKIILALLLLLCLANMPYGYYQIVRFGALIGFSILAYDAYKKGLNNYIILFTGLALLFQPFIKIALGRQMWNFVDVVIAIWLLLSVNDSSKNK
jgi:hypothetical protein